MPLFRIVEPFEQEDFYQNQLYNAPIIDEEALHEKLKARQGGAFQKRRNNKKGLSTCTLLRPYLIITSCPVAAHLT